VLVLNVSQLVMLWWELLLLMRDVEFCRVLFDVRLLGIYVIEVVNGSFKVYIVVVILDVGLVMKTALG